MAGFDDVTVSWDGKDYTIPANRVLGLVVRIEDLILTEAGESPIKVILRGLRPALMAAAFERVLDYVGAPYAPGEVYLAIAGSMIDGDAATAEEIQRQHLLLLSLMNPPAHLRLTAPRAAGEDEDEAAGKN